MDSGTVAALFSIFYAVASLDSKVLKHCITTLLMILSVGLAMLILLMQLVSCSAFK